MSDASERILDHADARHFCRVRYLCEQYQRYRQEFGRVRR